MYSFVCYVLGCVAVTCFCPWTSCLRTAGRKAAGCEPDLGGTREGLHPNLQTEGICLDRRKNKHIQGDLERSGKQARSGVILYLGSQRAPPAGPCWSYVGSCTAAPVGSCCWSGRGPDPGPSPSLSLSPPGTDQSTRANVTLTEP